MIEPRTAIANGEWIITCQLEVDGHPTGDPLTLRYADSYCAGSKSATKDTKSSTSMPENVGYLIARAIYERAKQIKPGRKRK